MRNKIKGLRDVLIQSHVFKRKFIFFPLLFFIFTTHVYAGWVTGYTYKSKLTIQGAQVCGATSHTNFPILIQVIGNSFKPSPSLTARNLWNANLRTGTSTRFFNGQIYEVRISDIVRSTEWIGTEFNNQNNPITFVSLVNLAPDLGNVEGIGLNYTEEDPATIISAAITASDVDNANLAYATITVTGNYVNGEDQLSFTNTANITGSWEVTSGKLTLTGVDTYTNYELALRAVTYTNLNTGNPSTLTRTVSFIVNDGTDNSNTVIRTITIIPVNDAPVAVNDFFGTTQNVASSGNVLTNDTDVEGNTLSLTTTAVSGPSIGSLNLNTNGSFTYTPNINFVGTDSFTYQVCDNGSPSLCSQGVVTITVTGATPPSGCSGNNPGGGSSTSGLYAEYYTNYYNDVQNFFDTNTPALIRNTDGPFNYSNNFGGVSSPIAGVNPQLFSARYRGSIYLATSGSYTFYLTADDAAYIWIDQAALVSPAVTSSALINNGGLHAAVRKQATVYLAAGLHNILMHFGNNAGLAVLKLEYSGPGIASPTIIPASGMCSSVQSTVALNDTYTTGMNVTLSGTTVLVNDTNSGGNPLVVNTTPIAGPTNGSLTLNADGTFTYTPSANFVGSDNFTYQVCNTGSPSVCSQAVVFINVVNNAPSFTKGGDQNINEDAGAQTVTSWATAINDGDPGISQPLTFNVSNNNNALFSTQPAINASGDLTYTASANANGVATVTVTLSDDGSNVAPSVNTSAAQTFTITINAVNDAPSFTKGGDQNINEDAGAQTVTSWATAINDGDPELTQTLTFNVSNNNNALFSAQPSINASGDLTFTPAANVNGTATVTVTLSDNGSNVAPNVKISAAQTFTITVNAVNDVPSFTISNPAAVLEDSGPQTVTSLATSINDGDPELTQTLTFIVSNNNNLLFSAQPTINASGDLTYTPAANANGTATVTVTLSDNGSNIAPNDNTSAAQTFIITINAVNDVPSFTKGSDQNINEDAGAQTVTSWATDINDGDPELTQTLTFNVTNNNNALFSAQPSINASGALTYRPAANANGTATVTVTLSDNGSNIAPNVNISAAQTFTINVNAVNDSPIAIDDGPLPYNSILPITIDVLANDSDPDNSLAELSIVSVTDPSIGIVTISDNKIIYQPTGTESGTVTFSYTISDPDGLTDDAIVTIEYEYNPFKVSEGFSPNGDGSNETWYIRHIEAYPNNVIQVFDRWGILVYRASKYDNASVVWDGRANTGIQSGNLVDRGTYFYALNLGDKSGVLSGYVEIVR